MRLLSGLLLLLLAPVAAPTPAFQDPAREPEAPASASETAPRAVLDRIAVMGASASAGFGLKVSLAQILEAAIAADHEPILDVSDRWMFRSPLFKARTMVAQAGEHRPTLVVAVDFLFWCAYGTKPGERRLSDLEVGLEQLDTLRSPTLIGLVPDMTPAVGFMITAEMVPEPETLAAINRRIREWASSRERVTIVPMVRLLDDMRAGKPFSVGPNEWPGGEPNRLLQPDKLHPNLEGTVALVCLLVQEIRAAHPGLAEGDFLLDSDAIRERVSEVAERARRERLERKRRERLERRREAEGSGGGDGDPGGMEGPRGASGGG